MSECTASGPCEEMAHAVARGAVVRLGARAALPNGMYLGSCVFCHEPIPLATVAGWPWQALRAAGEVNEGV